MLRKVTVSAILIVVILAVAGGSAYWLLQTAPIPQRKDVPEVKPTVQVVRVWPETVKDEIEGYGTVLADQAVELASQVAAPVERLVPQPGPGPDGSTPLEEGVAVQTHALLIQLDHQEFRQALARAQSQRAASQARLEELDVREENLHRLIEIASGEERVARDEVARVSALFESNQAAKREYDLARMTWFRADRELQNLKSQLAAIEPQRAQEKATREARQAEIELARINIERCQIRAPFAGVVDRLDVETGQSVQPGSPLLRLVSTDRVEIPILLPVSTRPRLSVGAPCLARMESLPEVTWTGQVARLSPSADPRSRTYRAYIEVDNRDQAVPLLPGYFVKATLEGQVLKDVLLVPRVAILDESRIFVANDSHARLRQVEVMRHVKDRAVVRGDIQPGERVIISHLDKVTEGMGVEIATDSAP